MNPKNSLVLSALLILLTLPLHTQDSMSIEEMKLTQSQFDAEGRVRLGISNPEPLDIEWWKWSIQDERRWQGDVGADQAATVPDVYSNFIDSIRGKP